ncbi:MAG: hypothetical protein CM15mP120_19310 [Pseudomonadota bacterium]|nr:MAG: hypothetical protein CM15mP120_19310 [Pseudomonadota bacterium]
MILTACGGGGGGSSAPFSDGYEHCSTIADPGALSLREGVYLLRPLVPVMPKTTVFLFLCPRAREGSFSITRGGALPF